MTLSILFSGFAALAALALAMPPHAGTGFGSAVSIGRRRTLRTVGWAILTGLFVVAIRRHGWAVGVTYGVAALAVSGFAVTLVLTYRPRMLPLLATGALMVAGGILVFVR